MWQAAEDRRSKGSGAVFVGSPAMQDGSSKSSPDPKFRLGRTGETAQTIQIQDRSSLSGFTQICKDIFVHDASTPSEPGKGDASSVLINIDRNNFNDDDPMQYDSPSAKSSLNNTMRPNIDVISLDHSPNYKPKQMPVFKNLDSGASTHGRNSPDILKPPQNNLLPIKRLQDEEGCKEGSASQAKTETPINVIARVRPLIPNEIRHPVCIEVVDESVVNGHKTQIVVRNGLVGSTLKSSDQKMYSFEKVLDTDTSQQKVFNDVEGASLCNAFINGQNCTIFVYGPTSTGKTFTM